jgi:hypothetical protein
MTTTREQATEHANDFAIDVLAILSRSSIHPVLGLTELMMVAIDALEDRMCSHQRESLRMITREIASRAIIT